MLLILTTLDDKAKLLEIGRGLLEQRLVACYNLLPIESGYWWQGTIETGSEYLMILKAPKANYEKVQAFIRQHSPFDTPEIVALKADQVDEKYLAWLSAETG